VPNLGIISEFSVEGYLWTGNRWEDFYHLHLEQSPLWEITLSYSMDDKAAFFIQAFLKREYLGLSHHNLPAVLPNNPVALENRQVSLGYLWYNFNPLELTFGRNRIHYGPLKSSLLPSSRLPFIDMLRFKLPLGALTMDLVIATLENRQAVGDVTPGAPAYDFKKSIIFSNIHRFEYNFGFLRAGVTGIALYVRENNAFVLADFFPVFSWHSSDIVPNNMNLICDFDAVLFPGFRMMLMYGFDDINTTGIGVVDSGIPTIDACIWGIEYSRKLPFARLILYGENGYTHYLWGNFDDDVALARAIYRLALDQGTRILPLTSPFGPGAIWFLGDIALEDWRGFSSSFFFELVFKNPMASLVTTSYEKSETIKNAPKEGTLSLGFDLCYHGLSFLDIYARPVFYYRTGQRWFELTLGGTLRFDRSFEIKL
jgi:hypothetical protein